MANIDKLEQVLGVPGHYEPVFTYTILKGCKCGAPHPKAFTYWESDQAKKEWPEAQLKWNKNDATCPNCSLKCKVGKSKEVPAQLGLPTVVSNFIKNINRNIKGDND